MGNETIKVSLVGPEGYGKDSLAIKYITEKSSNFKCIFWLNSQSEDSLEKGFKNISNELNFKKDHQIKYILESLENKKDWLIVFSKASISTLENYIPKRGGSVLVTSTDVNWISLGFTKIIVDSFQTAIFPNNAERVFPIIAKNLYNEGDFQNAFNFYEKTKVLLEKENPQNEDKLEEIIREVAHCALKNGKPAEAIENYQRALHLQNKNKETIKCEGRGKSSAYYQYKIGECQRVNEDVSEAQKFYKKALASNSGRVVDPLLNSKIYRGISFCFEYQGKFEFALISFNKAIEIIRENLFYDSKYEFKYAKLKLNIASCLFKQRMIPEALKLYKESCHIFEHHAGSKRNKIRLAEALTGIASCYNCKGEGNESLILYQKALSIIETLCAKNHIKTVNIHIGIGQSYYYKRDIRSSMAEYEKANDILCGITNSRSQHELNSNIFHGLGLCYLKLGNYEKGHSNFEKALNFKKNRYNGDKNLEYAATLNGKGWAFYHQKDLSKAIEIFRRAEEISLYLGQVESVEYSDTLHGLGSCINYQEMIEESKDYFDKSIKIKEKHFGANHGEVAYLLYSIGRYYYGKESKGIRDADFGEGEKYCEQALRSSKFDKIERKSNFECASVLDGLATFLRKKGKNAKAQERFEEGKKIKEIHFGRDHLMVGHSLMSIGHCKQTGKMLEFGNALKDYDEALRIFKLHLPENHDLIKKVKDRIRECKGHKRPSIIAI